MTSNHIFYKPSCFDRHSSERSELVNLITYESNHSTYARPVKTWLLEPYIPWTYYSSARSYAQSTEATWQDYIKVNGSQHNYRYSYYENRIHTMVFQQKQTIHLNNKDAYYESYFLYHDGPTGYYQNMLSRPKSLSQFARKYANSVTQSTKQLKQCKSNWHGKTSGSLSRSGLTSKSLGHPSIHLEAVKSKRINQDVTITKTTSMIIAIDLDHNFIMDFTRLYDFEIALDGQALLTVNATTAYAMSDQFTPREISWDETELEPMINLPSSHRLPRLYTKSYFVCNQLVCSTRQRYRHNSHEKIEHDSPDHGTSMQG